MGDKLLPRSERLAYERITPRFLAAHNTEVYLERPTGNSSIAVLHLESIADRRRLSDAQLREVFAYLAGAERNNVVVDLHLNTPQVAAYRAGLLLPIMLHFGLVPLFYLGVEEIPPIFPEHKIISRRVASSIDVAVDSLMVERLGLKE